MKNPRKQKTCRYTRQKHSIGRSVRCERIFQLIFTGKHGKLTPLRDSMTNIGESKSSILSAASSRWIIHPSCIMKRTLEIFIWMDQSTSLTHNFRQNRSKQTEYNLMKVVWNACCVLSCNAWNFGTNSSALKHPRLSRLPDPTSHTRWHIREILPKIRQGIVWAKHNWRQFSSHTFDCVLAILLGTRSVANYHRVPLFNKRCYQFYTQRQISFQCWR